MKKTLAILTVLALTLPFVGCEKEEDNGGMIEIFAEAMHGGSKVLLDGANATWVDGEKIRINSDEATVERRGDRAYISYASPQEVNRALYPSSLNVTSWGGDNVTVTFPSYYHYRTDGAGHQILDLPMAARSEGSDPLQFKHLTGALYITITNTASVPLTLQSVTVKSNYYQLSGSRAIDLTTFAISGVTTGTSDDRKVTVLFDTGYTLATDASLKVMLPIMPVESNNRFTIEVKSFEQGEDNVYLYSRTQSGEGDCSLLRNQLGYAPVGIAAEGSAPLLEQESGHYVVRTPLEFVRMAQAITSRVVTGNDVIDILEDMDMTGISLSPIVNVDFTGTIDGHNNTISNLTINSVEENDGFYCAMFEKLNSGLMCDIVFDNISLNHQRSTSKQIYMAALIGSSENFGGSGTLTLRNCTVRLQSVTITEVSGQVNIGGLIASFSGTSNYSISNCQVDVPEIDIIGRTIYFGGIIGVANSINPNITSSSVIIAQDSEATLTATKNIIAGGLIGGKTGGNFTATNNAVEGRIVATSESGAKRFIGSLIGEYSNQGVSTTTGTITTNFTASLNGNEVTPINNYGTNLAK